MRFVKVCQITTSTTLAGRDFLVFNMDKSSKSISMAKSVVKTMLQKRETQKIVEREQTTATRRNCASTLQSMRMAEEPRPHGLLCQNGTLNSLGEIGGAL